MKKENVDESPASTFSFAYKGFKSMRKEPVAEPLLVKCFITAIFTTILRYFAFCIVLLLFYAFVFILDYGFVTATALQKWALSYLAV